MMKERWKW